MDDGKSDVQPVHRVDKLLKAAGDNKKIHDLLQVVATRGNKGRFIIVTIAKVEGHMPSKAQSLEEKMTHGLKTIKFLLVQAQWQVDKLLTRGKRIAYLADPGKPDVQNLHTVITNNAAYQADELDAYESECDRTSIHPRLLHGTIFSRNGGTEAAQLRFEVPKERPTVSNGEYYLKKLKTPFTGIDQNLKKQDNSDCVGVNSNDCMSSDNVCVSNAVNVVKSRAKLRKIVMETNRKVFTSNKVYTMRPYRSDPSTIVGNVCPLKLRLPQPNEVPSRKPIVLDSESPKPVVKLVYSRKPRKNKNAESVSNTKVLKPLSANKQEPSKSWLGNPTKNQYSHLLFE
ncbi:hypothetical protein Tco_1244285 [Tanacetum coccineum]